MACPSRLPGSVTPVDLTTHHLSAVAVAKDDPAAQGSCHPLLCGEGIQERDPGQRGTDAGVVVPPAADLTGDFRLGHHVRLGQRQLAL